jgi:hypothetical protein
MRAAATQHMVCESGQEGDRAHAAVTPRPPISLDTVVARTEGSTYDAAGWDSVHRSRAISWRAVPNPSLTIRHFFHRCRWRHQRAALPPRRRVVGKRAAGRREELAGRRCAGARAGGEGDEAGRGRRGGAGEGAAGGGGGACSDGAAPERGYRQERRLHGAARRRPAGYVCLPPCSRTHGR